MFFSLFFLIDISRYFLFGNSPLEEIFTNSPFLISPIRLKFERASGNLVIIFLTETLISLDNLLNVLFVFSPSKACERFEASKLLPLIIIFLPKSKEKSLLILLFLKVLTKILSSSLK